MIGQIKVNLFISSSVHRPNSEVKLGFPRVLAQSSSCAYYAALQPGIMVIFLLRCPSLSLKEKEGAPEVLSDSSAHLGIPKRCQVLCPSVLLVQYPTAMPKNTEMVTFYYQ